MTTLSFLPPQGVVDPSTITSDKLNNNKSNTKLALLKEEMNVSSAAHKTVCMEDSRMEDLHGSFIEFDVNPDTLWEGIHDDDDTVTEERDNNTPQRRVPRKSFLTVGSTISFLSDDELSLETEDDENRDHDEELTEELTEEEESREEDHGEDKEQEEASQLTGEEESHEDDENQDKEQEESIPVEAVEDTSVMEVEQIKETSNHTPTTAQKRAKRFASLVQKNKAFLADHKFPSSIYNDDASVASGCFSIAGQSAMSADLSTDTLQEEEGEEEGEEAQQKGARGRRRRSSTVRFGSIVLNEVDVEALQEEIQLQEAQKTWGQRRRDAIKRNRLQRRIRKQMHILHKAHGRNTLLHPVPDKREETKTLTTTVYPSPTGEGLSVGVKFSGKESQSFYTKMPSFTAFNDFTRDEYFQRAPHEWHVVITDVKGSTKAIEAGRYKDVNTIGAASISVVLNLLDEDTPFVFGGDGATLLIPPADIGRVLEALLRVQRLSEQNFELGLRVGHITVGEVHKAGGKIEIAKHELTAGRCAAVFRGGGLTVAEACIKGQEDKYCLQWKHSSEEVELGGLSCRWNAIPSKRGKIMSLLVCAREGESTPRVYDHVLQELDKIYDGQLDEANPVNTELMYYKTAGQCYEDEKRWHTNKWSASFAHRVAEIFVTVGIFKHGFDPKFFNPKQYFESMRPHADHRKFDDMLRMVIDCSEEQAEAIEDLMEGLYMDEKVHYGIFLSDTALMTCYLEDVVDGQHIHFIDGGDGGYAMAAKQLKAQLKNDLAGV